MTNDLTGKRYGMLVAVAPTDQRKAGYTVWRCRCDCGREILVESRRLKRGTISDCGCTSVRARRDLRGQRFGKLLAVKETNRRGKGGSVIWHCQCDCGNTIDAPSNQLLSGYRKSCGCLSRPPLKNWIGKQFGDLTVLSYAGKRDGAHLWHCRCQCGNELDVRQSNLQTGHTQSCGCRFSPLENRHFVDGTCIEMITSQTVFKNNTSGIRGVYQNKRSQKWVAQITFKGRTYYLGSFENKEDAAKARQRGEEMYEDFLAWYYAEHPAGAAVAAKEH